MGLIGKAYILPDAAKEEEIRGFLNLFYAVFAGVILIALLTVGIYYCFAAVPLLYFWYWLSLKRMLRGVQTLKFEEASKAWASTFDLATLWFLAVASFLFVAGCVFLLFQFPSDWFIVLVCIIGVLIFGAAGFAFGCAIKVKQKEE